jgi:ubiquinone/menaquinone biosynthesis C-methylase UbiE
VTPALGAYATLASPVARAALQENYANAGNIYKFWADWGSVVGALTRGWERATNHPAQLHYAWDLGASLDEAVRCTTHAAGERLGITERDAQVLDAGCGFGGCTTQLAAEHPRWTVTGVSIVAEQVAIATSRATRLRTCNAVFLAANYLDLPTPDEHFDGAIAMETFCHVPRSEKTHLFAEMHRVLKPGAKLVVYDAYKHDIATEAAKDYKHFLTGLALPDLTSVAETEDAAQQTGFAVLASTDATTRILGASQLAARRARHLRPLIGALGSLPPLPIINACLTSAGWNAQSATAFADAAISQGRLFAQRSLTYHAHVFGR